MGAKKPPRIPLPKSWTRHARVAMLHVVSLARYATAYTRGWAANSVNVRVRLKVENDRLQQEIALLREEIRVKDARMILIGLQRRPHYPAVERMSILELRAARGWSLQQTADTFLVTATTIASWMRRVDEEGPNALVQLREPVNRFPDFVRYAVQRLKTFCPSMGKVKIAQTLCRAGLHLGSTTVGRMLREMPETEPPDTASSPARVVIARKPNHVWHMDLTIVPTGAGFWAPWSPFALPQCWPFCWWVAVIIDQYSRRAIGFAVFSKRPTSPAISAFLESAIAFNATPKYLVCDQDKVFTADDFTRWLVRKHIKPRYGAVGQHGSIAVVERFIRTLKDEGMRRIMVPAQRDTVRREIGYFVEWYNETRPHSALDGQTPNEVYNGLLAANRRPRIEPRERWHRRSPCAKPRSLVAGKPGDQFTLNIDYHAGRSHLPIV
ncbi:MAG: DDE-type integrase/transposase/recombinase, partial [Gammaproteobacteria bacterium]|nr:DDE-type integrase/transposase/recombinase [Gammaproteobacteria bacterium]